MQTTVKTPRELTVAELGNRETIRKNSANYTDVRKIKLSSIEILADFNVREDYGNIPELAASLKQNGQRIAGIVDSLATGNFALIEGHRRVEALKLLWAEDGNDPEKEPFFLATVNTQKTTTEQRILDMFITQDNKKLTPHEAAELMKRLVNLGHSATSIATMIGKSESYVSQMLSYANESSLIKDEVVAGNLTVSAVNKLAKEIPQQTERIKKVKDAVAKKKEVSGTGKVTKPLTVEDVTGIDKHELCWKEMQDEFDMEDHQKGQLLTIISKYF